MLKGVKKKNIIADKLNVRHKVRLEKCTPKSMDLVCIKVLNVFSGKTIVPFATSGSSGIGDSGKNIGELAKDAKVETGLRFKAKASIDELKAWAKDFV